MTSSMNTSAALTWHDSPKAFSRTCISPVWARQCHAAANPVVLARSAERCRRGPGGLARRPPRICCISNEDRLTAAPSALPLRRFIQLSVLQASAAVPSSADGRRDQIGGARVDQDTVQRRVRLDLTAMLLGSQQGDHLIA
jgi:hypothetical protein